MNELPTLNADRKEFGASLFPTLGVYGWWLAVYGLLLDPHDELVRNIMQAYELLHRRVENGAIAILMGRIDDYCRIRNCETPDECSRRIGVWP